MIHKWRPIPEEGLVLLPLMEIRFSDGRVHAVGTAPTEVVDPVLPGKAVWGNGCSCCADEFHGAESWRWRVMPDDATIGHVLKGHTDQNIRRAKDFIVKAWLEDE